jgi:hypothetical protein
MTRAFTDNFGTKRAFLFSDVPATLTGTPRMLYYSIRLRTGRVSLFRNEGHIMFQEHHSKNIIS